MIRIGRALFCVILAASTALAEGGTKLSQATSDPLGAGTLPVVGMHDMEGRRWGVAASPFLWKTSQIGRDGSCCTTGGSAVAINPDLPSLHGRGGSLAVNYEFTPHWGAQIFGGAAVSGAQDLGNQISGLATKAAFNGTPGGAGFVGGSFNKFNGTVVGAMVTWDPYNRPNGFRLPISLGVFQGWQSFDFNHAFTNPNNGAAQTESVHFRRSYPGVVAAISFDFLLFHRVRLMPGILVGQGFAGQEASYDYEVSQNGAPSQKFRGTLSGTPGFGTVYLTATYRPWGLGYTVTVVPDVSSTQALTWSHHWGLAQKAAQ